MTTSAVVPPQKSWSEKFMTSAQPFAIGGISGVIATCIIQPVDMIKVMIQIKSEQYAKAGNKGSVGPMEVFKEIKATQGFRGFYRGLDSAIARQIFYTTTRLGLYKTITGMTNQSNKAKGIKELSFFQKAYCASFAGFVGALVGNPADLALLRMQADSRLPQSERRNYKNVVDAFRRISKEEGFLGLWRGASPTVIRAVVLNLAMLSSYDEVKERMMKYMDLQKENLSVRLGASLVSGLLSSFSSLPFDNAKTKLQKMKPDANGVFPYKNIFDAMGKTISGEGFSKMWVGFPTFYFRIAPHICITLITQDLLTDFAKQYFKKSH